MKGKTYLNITSSKEISFLKELGSAFVDMSSGGALTADYFGKVVVVNAESDMVLIFPVLTTDDIGDIIAFEKSNCGRLTIQADASFRIQDSGFGGTIYCPDGTIAWLGLRVVSLTSIVIVDGIGNWITT
jgi:hypothetical protein